MAHLITNVYDLWPFLSAGNDVETASQAVDAGVRTVSIMDGRVRHCVLKALSGEVFGTKIVQGK